MTTAFVHSPDASFEREVGLRRHPSLMTPEERAAEVWELRNPPIGVPFRVVDERIEGLINRKFNRLGNNIPFGPNLEGFNEWIASIERVPAIADLAGWQALAEEARHAY